MRGFSWITHRRVLLDRAPLLPVIGFTLDDYGFRVMKRRRHPA